MRVKEKCLHASDLCGLFSLLETYIFTSYQGCSGMVLHESMTLKRLVQNAVFLVAVSSATVYAGSNFTIVNGRCYDPEGNLFIPIGGNMNGYHWGWSKETAPLVDMLADAWRFNCIRLNCYVKGHHRRTDSQTGEPSTTYTVNNNLDEIIRVYTEKKVVVQIVGHDWTCRGFDVRESPEELDSLLMFYLPLAERHKDNPYVWFNPVNEAGKVAANMNVEGWYHTHGKFIEAIRETGNNNMIICDGIACGQDHGNSWGDNGRDGKIKEETSAILTWGEKLFTYGGHNYSTIGFSFHAYSSWGTENEDLMRQYVEAVSAKNLFLHIGETGYYSNKEDSQTGRAVNRAFKYALPRGVGPLAWHLQPGDGFAQTSGGTFSLIGDDWENPQNLTWTGKLFWKATHELGFGRGGDLHSIPDEIPRSIPVTQSYRPVIKHTIPVPFGSIAGWFTIHGRRIKVQDSFLPGLYIWRDDNGRVSNQLAVKNRMW
jgi:mannan endo-1,4-beta-mannosidase